MKTITAEKFQEQCLLLLGRMNPAGVLITKNGKPVARLTPVQSEGERLIGKFKGKIKINGNILSTGAKWNAES